MSAYGRKQTYKNVHNGIDEQKMTDQRSPSSRILTTALIVGGISFALGYIGPIFFSDSNLGPLLGIFITGPLGTLAGALIGVVWSAREAEERTIEAELWWLGSIWGLSLLYLYAFSGVFAVAFQGLVIATGALLFIRRTTRRHLPEAARRYGLVLLFAATVIVLAAMFPPVTEPWWVPEEARSSEPLPEYAFFLDSRFDASDHYPTFAIAEGQLVREWAIIAATAGVVCLFGGMYGRLRKGG